MGEAPEAIVLVETPEDVDRLEVAGSRPKLAYLTQTTLSVDDANRIIDRLRERFPQIANPPKEDICYATQNRQEAVEAAVARGRRWCWCWGARTARTASGWPNWRTRAACRPT